MDYKIVTLESRIIAGYRAKTSNSSPEMPQIIGSLWQSHLSGKPQGATYALYYNYENGVSGSYDVLVGSEAPSLDGLAPQLSGTVIPAGRYARFSFIGNPQTDTAGFWQKIWSMPLSRKFTCDFEEYPPCDDWEHAPIHFYIALQDE